MIKATRMEYLRLKKRLKTAQRGHKLLKDKRDGLMKTFMEAIRDAKIKRAELEEKMSVALSDFAKVNSSISLKEVEQMFALPEAKAELSVAKKNIMSVWVPQFTAKIEGNFKIYSHFSAPMGLNETLEKLEAVFSLMIALAQVEHSARLLSFEIEKTRRRVNGLEFVIIPQMRKNIKNISSKLDEMERSDKIIRMKVKELIS